MRWLVLSALTLWLGVADSRAQNYPTPGFDCANISTPQELRICRSPQLGELDGLYWYLAERAIKASRDPERTRADVEGWIAHVRNACETDACLAAAYTARIAELERGVAKLAPPPAQPVTPPFPAAGPAKPAAAVAAPVPKPEPPAPAAIPDPEKSGAPIWPWLLALALVAIALVAKK